ncbi:MAG: hypothetical protein C4292_06915, partial [Nitrososphaera sp.]
MARRDGVDPLIILGGLTVFELLAIKGLFGYGLQKPAVQIAQAFFGHKCLGYREVSMSRLISANPNFERQMW